MIRFLDVFIAGIGLLTLCPFMAIVYAICLLDTGAPLFKQRRIGQGKKLFTLVKFRTMHCDTPSVGSHLVNPSAVTYFGSFLRRTKIDELPQLWNVLSGEMSLVGPRPGLPNQVELTAARTALGVYSMRPGITGLAQVNRIDMSKPLELARMDALMAQNLNVKNYFAMIALTLLGRGNGDAAS
jgi:O-antigen biosynthesis protein WbqP